MNTTNLQQLKNFAQTNTYQIHGNSNVADCVIGFSFGYIDSNSGVLPGKSNLQLASLIENNYAYLPLLLQFEIDDTLQDCIASLVIHEHRQAGEYLNSREIAEQALIYMQSHGWTTAVIVTHPAMEQRNIAICQKLGIKTVAPDGLNTIAYDTQSAQPWSRDPQAWWERENNVIDICVERGWI